MKDDTRIVAAGRDPHANHGIVNPPVYHASTVLFPSYDALKSVDGRDPRKVVYGRHGTPTTHALQDAFRELEGGDLAVACASGKAAIAIALMAYLEAGDHILITDSSYQPTRAFARDVLKRFGVEATFYDPRIGRGIADLIRPGTRIVYTESPGSITFEVQDIPAIAEAAHARGALVVADNTWAGGYFCKPFRLGADVVLQAGTKYVVGHSDAMCGLIAAREPHCEALWKAFVAMGACLGPDDAYLGQRGVRTLPVRLRRHHETGLRLARWLRHDRRSRASCIPASRAAPTTPCGSGTSRAPAASSACCSGRWTRAGSPPCWTAPPLRHGLVLGRIRKPSGARRPRSGRTAAPWTEEGSSCASTRAWRTRTT